MIEQLKVLFIDQLLLCLTQITGRLGKEHLPALEEAPVAGAGFISAEALPGSSMSEIDPNHPAPEKRRATSFLDAFFNQTSEGAI